MQYNKTVKNHMLLGCIQLMKEDDRNLTGEDAP